MKKTALAARLNHACDCVSGAEALLTEIDSKFGDADHGLTLRAGSSPCWMTPPWP